MTARRPTEPRRVVVTGIGAITPIGSGRERLWQGVVRGASAVRTLTRFDPSPFPCRIAAEVADFDPLNYMDGRRARRLDRFAQFTLAASLLAMEDAGLRAGAEPDSTGVYLGSALGGVAFAEEQHTNFLGAGLRSVSPTLALAVYGGAGAAQTAIELGLSGPNITNANSCASGTIAIGEAFHAIRSGRLDVALAGGAEAPLAPLTFGAFALIKAMSTANDVPERASRPFDRRRDGFVMGEGAAVLVLEALQHARRRGVPILAELRGYGTTTDAHHMTAPLPDGVQAARAISLALDDAGLSPAGIGYINVHGSGTPRGDLAEATALKRALGEAAGVIPVSGSKGLHGHALGASGAIELATCVLALEHGWLPPTANLDDPDPGCDLDLIRGQGRELRPEIVLKTSFGFGGINAAVVLARPSAEGT